MNCQHAADNKIAENKQIRRAQDMNVVQTVYIDNLPEEGLSEYLVQ